MTDPASAPDDCQMRRPLRLTFRAVVTMFCACVPLVCASTETVERYAACSAYFFMAANAKGMDEFDPYYRSGEFAYNRVVELVGSGQALENFNRASTAINELIEREWQQFERADNRYGVICADIYRAATASDP